MARTNAAGADDLLRAGALRPRRRGRRRRCRHGRRRRRPADDPRIVVDEPGDAARRGDRHELLGRALQDVRIGRIDGDDQGRDVTAGESGADQPPATPPASIAERRDQAQATAATFPPRACIDPRGSGIARAAPDAARLVAKDGYHEPLAATIIARCSGCLTVVHAAFFSRSRRQAPVAARLFMRAR